MYAVITHSFSDSFFDILGHVSKNAEKGCLHGYFFWVQGDSQNYYIPGLETAEKQTSAKKSRKIVVLALSKKCMV